MEKHEKRHVQGLKGLVLPVTKHALRLQKASQTCTPSEILRGISAKTRRIISHSAMEWLA